MPKLLFHRKPLLVVQETAPLLVGTCQQGVVHAVHGHDVRSTTTVWRLEVPRAEELSLDLIELRASPRQLLQAEIRAMRWAQVLWVLERAPPLPRGMATDVPAAAEPARPPQTWTDLSAAARVLGLIVVHGDMVAAPVPSPLQLPEGSPVDGRAQQDEGTHACAVALRDHALQVVAVQELPHVGRHRVVILGAQRRREPADPQVPGGVGGHPRVAAARFGVQRSRLACREGQGLLVLLRSQGAEAVRELAARGLLELHQEQGHGLDSVLALRKHVVVGARNPGVIQVGLPQHHLAEEHEGAATGILHGDVRILREVLARSVRLSAAPRGVEAVHGDGHNVLLRRTMPAIDDVGAHAKGRSEVILRGAQQKVQPWVAHLPRAHELPMAPRVLPLLLQKAPLRLRCRHQHGVLRG
mmetsp:Transcript_56672/g.147286  ORF Transcript_56672/g.147286 Transcript_56672/m.147286 type:complete len:413 (+) Transcript_56672:804-2042(+)